MRLLRLICLFAFLILLQSCQVGRMIYYNYAEITDHKIFPSRTIEKGDEPFSFPNSENPIRPDGFHPDLKSGKFSLESFLIKDNTVAFVVIHKDSIHYEEYFNGYDRESVVASFSMAKSLTSILIGMAIDDGYIGSVNDKVGQYIPEIKDERLRETSILRLLQMTSGLKFDEGYSNPFGEVGAFYYGRNLRNKIYRLKLKKNPKLEFNYQSGNSQLLGLILNNALPEGKTVSSYMEEKIWKPVGMEYNATWSTDDQKENALEKTFCCFNARALDFAKFGRLYLNKGRYNGKQIVPKSWVEESTKVDTTAGSAWYYQYQWWLPTKHGDYTANGILGQYIYVNPEKELIIVRLGKNEKLSWKKLFPKIAELY